MERLLKAIANRRRIMILAYLRREKEAPVGEIASAIRLSVRSTSRHLRILAAADILVHEQRRLTVFYRIAGELAPVVRALLPYFRVRN